MMKFLKVMPFVLFAVGHAIAAGGAQNVGGGNIERLRFTQSRYTVAARVSSLTQETLETAGISATQSTWLVDHKDALKGDILASPHVWSDELPLMCTQRHTCACTEFVSTATIEFSNLSCKGTDDKMAEKLLIHESLHHLGVVDEGKADTLALAVANVTPASGTLVDPRIPILRAATEDYLQKYVLDFALGRKPIVSGKISIYENYNNASKEAMLLGRNSFDFGRYTLELGGHDSSSEWITLDTTLFLSPDGHPSILFRKNVTAGVESVDSPKITHLDSDGGRIKSVSFQGIEMTVNQKPVGTLTGDLRQIPAQKITFENLRDSEKALYGLNGLEQAERDGRIAVVNGIYLVRSEQKEATVRHWREIADPSDCPTAAVRECAESFNFELSFSLPANNLSASTGKVAKMSPLATSCKCLR